MLLVYFYLAVFDALKDIRGQWGHTKSRIQEAIYCNDGLSPKISTAFVFV